MRDLLSWPAGNSTQQRMDDFKNYIEARLGKPSHLLDGDKLRQFLQHNKQVRKDTYEHSRIRTSQAAQRLPGAFSIQSAYQACTH